MAYVMTWTHERTAAAMTRSTVQKLEYDRPLPKRLLYGNDELKKIYEEVFIASADWPTEEEAKQHLQDISRSYPFVDKGWYCPGGSHEGVFEEKGKWYAYRHHAKYI